MLRPLFATLTLAACTTTPPSSGPQANSHVDSFDEPSLNVPRNLDVLFVIDDSPAMAAHRDHVLAAAPAFASAMFRQDLPGSLRVAVVTTDPADGGVLRTAAPIAGAYLTDELYTDGSRATNYSGSLADALAALLDAGTTGASAIQPLATAQRALATPGFVRSAAYLAVVVIAASDDASPDTVASYAVALESQKIDPASVIAIAIDPAPQARLDAWVDRFPNRGTSTPIDQADLGTGLALLDELVKTLLGYPCIEQPLDADPATDGGQYDCAISAVVSGADGIEHERVLPACPQATGTCWTLAQNACPTGYAYITLLPVIAFRPHLRGQCVVGN